MLDETRIQLWKHEAEVNLCRFYSTNDPAGHSAAIILALLKDREERENYCARVRATESVGAGEP